MIAILNNRVEDSIKQFKTEIDAILLDTEKRLQDLIDGIYNIRKRGRKPSSPKPIKNKLVGEELKYVEEIKNNLSVVLKGNAIQLETLKIRFSNLISSDEMKDKKKKKFKNDLIEALNYTNLRSDFYPKYFNHLGIKACVYCNSQLTISATSTENWYTPIRRKKSSKSSVKAKFQVDHFIPKSEYPCFSISFYNLYPVCASCNNAKSTSTIKFKLYTDILTETKQSDFEFVLNKGCVAIYDQSKNQKDLGFNFEDKKDIYLKTMSNGHTQDTFDIKGIYDTQIDIIEELVIKAKIYKESYKGTLVKSFHGLFTNASISNRILIGNYTTPEEIHKRPMAKFTQDIAKQLGLIN